MRMFALQRDRLRFPWPPVSRCSGFAPARLVPRNTYFLELLKRKAKSLVEPDDGLPIVFSSELVAEALRIWNSFNAEDVASDLPSTRSMSSWIYCKMASYKSCFTWMESIWPSMESIRACKFWISSEEAPVLSPTPRTPKSPPEILAAWNCRLRRRVSMSILRNVIR